MVKFSPAISLESNAHLILYFHLGKNELYKNIAYYKCSGKDFYNHATSNLAIYSHETSQDMLSEA